MYKSIDGISFSVLDENVKNVPHGRRTPRQCRFCGKGEPDVTFKKEAHIIPQALGNRAHVSLEECDECNQKASALENELAIYLTLERAVGRIRTGKKSYVKHKKPDGKSFVKSGADSSQVEVSLDPNDESVSLREVGESQLELSITRGPFSLYRVAKAFARMAWFLMPADRLKEFQHINDWIAGRASPFPVTFLRGFYAGSGFSKTTLILFERERDDSQHPPYLINLFFGPWIFVMGIPDNSFKIEKHVVPADEALKDVLFEATTLIKDGRLPASTQKYNIQFQEKQEGSGPEP
ncbi:MAG: HNH endonuclease [Elusimicrobiota bacterium]